MPPLFGLQRRDDIVKGASSFVTRCANCASVNSRSRRWVESNTLSPPSMGPETICKNDAGFAATVFCGIRAARFTHKICPRIAPRCDGCRFHPTQKAHNRTGHLLPHQSAESFEQSVPALQRTFQTRMRPLTLQNAVGQTATHSSYRFRSAGFLRSESRKKPAHPNSRQERSAPKRVLAGAWWRPVETVTFIQEKRVHVREAIGKQHKVNTQESKFASASRLRHPFLNMISND